MDSNLLNNYHNLMEERIMLENVIIKNNTLNAAYNDSTTIVTARYYEYVALLFTSCLLYTSPSPRDGLLSRMPSSA